MCSAYTDMGLYTNGKIQPFIGQVVSTAIGIAITVAISDILFPW